MGALGKVFEEAGVGMGSSGVRNLILEPFLITLKWIQEGNRSLYRMGFQETSFSISIVMGRAEEGSDK